MAHKYYAGTSGAQMTQAFIAQYLTKSGWLRSVETKESCDARGPVPWITYSALAALRRIVKPDMRVFEFGSGNSSLWWGKRVAKVYSVEHDLEWFSELLPNIQAKDTLVHVPQHTPVDATRTSFFKSFFGGEFDAPPGPDAGANLRSGRLLAPFEKYAATLLEFPPRYFDIVVVDGMARVLTAWVAARCLGPRGFVVFDNSDRDFYKPGFAALEEAGFRRIDFWGPGPINPYEWCTSIFTRTLDIFPCTQEVS